MKIKKHSYFLFGSNFFAKLQPILQEQGDITGTMLNISPLSEISASVQTENNTLVYWLSELDSMLESSHAEYFVLNLQNALQPLLSSGGNLVSASEDNLKSLTRKEIGIIDPMLLDQAVINDALDRLISVIGKHFASKQIILIHTNSSSFWLSGNNMRGETTPAPDAKHTQWLNNLEQQFCKKADCHFVDITRFYFYQKEVGKPLTNAVYEKECYLDVSNCIFSIADGGNDKTIRPDFALSLDRYVAYYCTLHKKALRIFLNSEYFLDKLVLSSSAEFVKKYREELIDLDALDWNNPEKALYALQKLKPDGTLTKICIAFNAVINGLYSENDVDYALMFRNEIVPDELITYLKEEYAPTSEILPIQINRYNAGYHFAKMVGLDAESFSTENTVAEPTVVDIFGSCIARTLFNVQDNDFVVNHYWFHVPPFEHRNKPIECDNSLFPAKMSWKDRLVKLQLEGKLYEDIENSESNWLMIDLYFLVSPNNFYYKDKDCFYGDFDHKISKSLKAQKVYLLRDLSIFGTEDNLIHAMDPWLDIIKKKYGNKIILVTGQRTDYWIGDDDRIYQQPANHKHCNNLLSKASEYIKNQLDCYMIDIGQYFLPDDLGYMRNTPVHKEDICYFASHDISRYIVDNLPKQKVFTQYDGQLHMKHLLRLAKNNSLALLDKALPLNELDKAVLNLGSKVMETRQNELAELYDKSDWNASLDNIVDNWGSKPALSNALRDAAKKVSKESNSVEFPFDYESYDDQILNNCNFPKISIKRVKNDKGKVKIQWKISEEATVRIYRRSNQSPWTLIGTKVGESFLDKTTAPLTDYQYTLCVEVTESEHVYLVNFTAPVAFQTAPAAPELISAVHFAGENILRWAAVPEAKSYRVYHKDNEDDKWKLCATVKASDAPCYKEPSKFPEGGELYTVRAQTKDEGTEAAGGFQPGLPALPL